MLSKRFFIISTNLYSHSLTTKLLRKVNIDILIIRKGYYYLYHIGIVDFILHAIDDNLS